MRQEIGFCETNGGIRLAYATSGSGPPLVKAANYLTHLEHDWQGSVWRPWLEALSRHHTLVRYDERGCGLSDRDVSEFAIDAWVRDLGSVVDALGLDRFPLLGISQGAAVSVAYAVAHPDRVSHLILLGGYARGRYHRDLDSEQRLQAETMINVIRVGWGQDNPAFRQLFTTMLMPDGSEDQHACLNELARVSASAENAARMEEAFYRIDVTDLAPRLRTPALVLHARDDAAIPFEEGRLLASLIPDARFVPLDSRNHVLIEREPAWARFLGEIRAFLDEPVTESSSMPGEEAFPELTVRERDVLGLIARGLDNDAIADRLYISPKTVRNHVTRIYTKLQVGSRAAAVVLAREAGLGRGP